MHALPNMAIYQHFKTKGTYKALNQMLVPDQEVVLIGHELLKNQAL